MDPGRPDFLDARRGRFGKPRRMQWRRCKQRCGGGPGAQRNCRLAGGAPARPARGGPAAPGTVPPDGQDLIPGAATLTAQPSPPTDGSEPSSGAEKEVITAARNFVN